MTLVEQIDRDGYALVPEVLSRDAVARLIEALSSVSGNESVRKRNESVFAIRNLLDAVPEIKALANSYSVRGLITPVLGADCISVRAILFDKTPDANWNVFWHQDLSIAVEERKDVAGFGPWTVKSGVQHVQPPSEILESMLTIRLHLDDCDETNGPLQVIPGSHAHGRLDSGEIQSWRAVHPAVTCTAAAGTALLMRPLILHASSSATSAKHRRVVHIEFAGTGLPGGLNWHGAEAAANPDTPARASAGF